MADAKGLVVAGGLFEGAAGVVEPKVGVLPQAVVVGGAAEAKGFENGEVDFGASGAPKMLVVCSGALGVPAGLLPNPLRGWPNVGKGAGRCEFIKGDSAGEAGPEPPTKRDPSFFIEGAAGRGSDEFS